MTQTFLRTLAVFVVLACAAAPTAADAPDRRRQFVVEHPTLKNLGFEWSIHGDANRNARSR